MFIVAQLSRYVKLSEWLAAVSVVLLLVHLVVLLSGLLTDCIQYFKDFIRTFNRSCDVAPTTGDLEQSVVGQIIVTLDRMRDTTIFEFTPQAERLDLVANSGNLLESSGHNILTVGRLTSKLSRVRANRIQREPT
jgi:predicted PurR-regulated permease PerM